MKNFEKPNRIEELEKKLYSPTADLTQQERKPLNPKEYAVPQDWATENLDKNRQVDYFVDTKQPNWFFRIFMVALLFFVGAGAYLGISWYLNSGVKASDIDIVVNAPLTIGAGEQFNFETTIQNKNPMDITFVEIEVQLPDGTRKIENSAEELRTFNEKVDLIRVGEIIKRNYSVLLFGEESEQKEITILLTYQTNNSSQLFKKEKKFDVVLSSTPVRLSVANVTETTSGQDVKFSLEVVSNSSKILNNVLIEAKYPFGFSYRSSTLPAQEDKKTWVISTLNPKETVRFDIIGTIEGQNKDDKFFEFTAGLQDPTSKKMQLVFTSKDTTIKIARPFLELALGIEEDNRDIIILDPDITRNAKITYKNNSDFTIRNGEISMKIEGPVIDKASVKVGSGFYQSLNNVITWDNSTFPKLASISPGLSESVVFSFVGRPTGTTNVIINPEATLTVNVKANRNPQNEVADTITNSIVKKIRFNTRPVLESEASYSTGIFNNTGPIPPKVEQKTTYTGTLTLRNTTNTISNGVVTMRVPNYVQFDGVFGPANESISFDPVTRILVWNVGTVAPKTGFVGVVPRVLHLQLGIIPSISQAGGTPSLLTNISFSGNDTFTGTKVSATVKDITTVIKDSKTFYDSNVSR